MPEKTKSKRVLETHTIQISFSANEVFEILKKRCGEDLSKYSVQQEGVEDVTLYATRQKVKEK